MKNGKYVIGVDYGTLSARCLLVNAESGEEIAESTFSYPHGVMDENLPCGKALPENYALQHPNDYLIALKETIAQVLRRSGVSAENVVGIGFDFTSCTMLPIKEDGTPLCMKEEFSENMHSYVKLWKHHGAVKEAELITRLAKERGEGWIDAYGGTISCEWAFPKILEILNSAPEVFSATDRFIEAGDWISLMLTGEEKRSATFAGYKWIWNKETGYPSNDFLVALDPRLDGIVGTKIHKEVFGVSEIAGYINDRGAEITGLNTGTVVALPTIDAHAALPALGVTDEGEMVLILGTSACHILNSREKKLIKGICGSVKDGVIPGFYTYEAGQAAVGDIFDWFVKNSVPASYEREACEKNTSIHKLLREKAKRLGARVDGIVALDWWNGNRNVLVNPELKGMISGFTLATKPEEIYRALIESTAFGLRVILERFEENGVKIDKLCAAGGIAMKDEMMMQIYADVLNREISVGGTSQASALSSAIYAATAAGIYSDITSAADKMSKPRSNVYVPISDNVIVYEKMYRRYKELHDYFGITRIAKGKN